MYFQGSLSVTFMSLYHNAHWLIASMTIVVGASHSKAFGCDFKSLLLFALDIERFKAVPVGGGL